MLGYSDQVSTCCTSTQKPDKSQEPEAWDLAFQDAHQNGGWKGKVKQEANGDLGLLQFFLMRPIVWVCSLGLYPSFSISCVVCAHSAGHVPLFATPWTAACQAPLSMGFPRQAYWIWLAISFSKGSSQLRNQTLVSCISCIAVRFFITLATRIATISKKGKVKVVSDSLWLRGSQPARLLCPWNSPGQDTGVDCHSLLQGIFPTQGSNSVLPRCRWVLYHLSHQKRLPISWSLLRFMSIELVTLTNHLILSCPLLLLPSIFSSIRIFSSESALCIKWPKYWSFSFSISPSHEYSGLISFRIDWCWSPCYPRDSQEFSPALQFKSINSSALSLFFFNHILATMI